MGKRRMGSTSKLLRILDPQQIPDPARQEWSGSLRDSQQFPYLVSSLSGMNSLFDCAVVQVPSFFGDNFLLLSSLTITEVNFGEDALSVLCVQEHGVEKG